MRGSLLLGRFASFGACGAAVLAVALLASGGARAADGDEDAAISCIVRLEHAGATHEGSDFGPSLEEASDLALEAACARACVPADPGAGADDSDAGPASEAGQGEQPAVDDPDGVEACIELCASEAQVLGTLCTDALLNTVWADGAFATEPDTDGAPAPDDEDASDP